MKITNAYVERTFNLGNYESLKIGFEANICEGDVPLEVTAELERMAFQHYNNSLAAKKTPTTQAPQHPLDKTQAAIETAKQVGQTKDAFGNSKSPAQIANENQAKREAQAKQNSAPSIPQENICPQCGGKKQPQYPVCYNCHMKEGGQA